MKTPTQKTGSSLVNEKGLSNTTPPVTINKRILDAQKFIRLNFRKTEEINNDFPAAVLSLYFHQATGTTCSKEEFTAAMCREGYRQEQIEESIFFDVDYNSVLEVESKSCMTMVSKAPMLGDWSDCFQNLDKMSNDELKAIVQEFLRDKQNVAAYNTTFLFNKTLGIYLRFMTDYDHNVVMAESVSIDEINNHLGIKPAEK